jgi:hypothetical protein
MQQPSVCVCIEGAHLKPRTNDPAEGVNARLLALANLLGLLVRGPREMGAEFRVDPRAILNRVRIVVRSRIETHACRLFNANARSARRRTLEGSWSERELETIDTISHVSLHTGFHIARHLK